MNNVLDRQHQKLADSAVLKRHFHPPRPNNFVYLLVPLCHELENYQQQIAENTTALNSADRLLLNICNKLAVAHNAAGALEYVDGWKRCLAERRNLQGIYWASHAILELENAGIVTKPFAAFARKHYPELHTAFVKISRSAIEVLRVNIYTSIEGAHDLLEQIAEYFNDESFRASVDRVEVAKNLGHRRGALPYPRLIVYLSTNCKKSLASTLDVIGNLLMASNQPHPVRDTYAHLWLSNATITQGYYLYKTYLELLGFIDDLYDSRSNYAFAKNSSVGDTVLRVISRQRAT